MMLKFKNDYTTLTATFEDFILLVYTVIDDLFIKQMLFYTIQPVLFPVVFIVLQRIVYTVCIITVIIIPVIVIISV